MLTCALRTNLAGSDCRLKLMSESLLPFYKPQVFVVVGVDAKSTTHGGALVHPTAVSLCATQLYGVFNHRMGVTSVGPLTPLLVWGHQEDCNENPTPQRDPKVMGESS